MKDVNVTDVNTLDMFASSLDRFSQSYTSTLRMVSSAADDDISTAGNILQQIELKLDEAKAQKERAQRELDNYRNDCTWRDTKPDPSKISALKREIEEAERRISVIKRAYEEAEPLHREVRHLAHRADSYISYASEIENLCDETSRFTRAKANSIRKYI